MSIFNCAETIESKQCTCWVYLEVTLYWLGTRVCNRCCQCQLIDSATAVFSASWLSQLLLPITCFNTNTFCLFHQIHVLISIKLSQHFLHWKYNYHNNASRPTLVLGLVMLQYEEIKKNIWYYMFIQDSLQ